MPSPRSIKIILTDVDGVWTDGRIIYSDQNVETKTFHVRDGLAIKLALRAGVEVAVITGRRSKIVDRRCEELGIRHVVQGAGRKVEEAEKLFSKLGLSWNDALYIGDDLPDLAAMKRAAISAAPSDAVAEVLAVANWRLASPGGRGALRELVERLFIERREWDGLVADFLK